MNKELGIVIVAGGSSSRYGEKNKLLELIGNMPIIAHSPMKFRNLSPDNHIVIVSNKENLNLYELILSKFIMNNSFSFAIGGNTRGDSVYNGLQYLKNFDIKYVAIHDAARPLASSKLMVSCLDQCIRKGSAVAAKKITDTIKSADEKLKIVSTIDRSTLWAMETPQVFNFADILTAYELVRKNKLSVTDDASAMEASGKEVYLVENKEYNQKITYPWDLPLANFIYNSK
ncbi:MAG: 2-C-methyl-D-erythritol 4-phosphate cytidylyltransferase [Lentisphaerae bacterium GWF2_38_69]|nr:MAG: 2-C-methyl-D-erythritol 4-phosphate cytidylyltransferase [Lentisphaerae bacterium GWF2_38_69]